MSLHLERDLEGHRHRLLGSGWFVHDEAGERVGYVQGVWHPSFGGLAMFRAQPLGDFDDRWGFTFFDTPQDALGALADHLTRAQRR